MQKVFTFPLFLFVLFASFLSPSIADARKSKKDTAPAEIDGYTINYENISIKEYVDFVGKIAGLNFIYEDQELNFNVTVVSEGPITTQNVMSSLVQILRIHGLQILEEDNNLLITANQTVKQVANLVTDNQPPDGSSPLVTRIFQIRNAKPEAVAGVIRPMISNDAILELFSDTRQIILTDITSNVQRIGTLIENLDSSQSPFLIESYQAKHNKLDFLINLATQIMSPMTQGDPFLLIPQELINRIYIVSTPVLVEKAVAVLTNVDSPPTVKKEVPKVIKHENVFIYKPQYQSAQQLVKSLDRISTSLEKSGYSEKELLDTIESAKVINETDSVLFTGTTGGLDKLKDILASVDVAGKVQAPVVESAFFMYKPLHRNVRELKDSLSEVISNLKKAEPVDKELIQTLESVKIVSTTHSLMFTGDQKTFAQVKDLLSSVDIASGKKAPVPAEKETFYLYKIQNATGPEFVSQLKNMAKDLKRSKVPEDALIESIDTLKLNKDSNSVLFTGTEATLNHLKTLLPDFDVPSSQPTAPTPTQFLIYKPKYLEGEKLRKHLEEIAENLEEADLADPGLLHALQTERWVKDTNSLIFTGDNASLSKVQNLLNSIDVAKEEDAAAKMSYIIYKPQYASKDNIEKYLEEVAKNIQRKKLDEPALLHAIDSMKWISASSSFMFSGTQKSLVQVRELLSSYDQPAAQVPEAAETSFFIYHLKFLSKGRLEEYLKEVADNLVKRKGEGDLVDIIRSAKWIDQTHSFMFSGTKPAIAELQQILSQADISTEQRQPSVQTTFILYPLKYASQDKVEAYLDKIANNLSKKKGQKEQQIANAIHSMKWIAESHSFMFSGTQTALNSIQQLLNEFDVSTQQRKPSPETTFFLYKPVHASQSSIEKYLERVGENLSDKKGLKEEDLIEAIHSLKWIRESHSFMFSGTQNALDQIRQLLTNFDTPSEQKTSVETSFILYHVKYAPQKKIEQYLEQIADNLNKKKPLNTSDKELIEAIDSMKWIQQSHSFMFSGTSDALTKINQILSSFDQPAEQETDVQPGYFIYKLQNIKGDVVEEDLDQFAKNLKTSGTPNEALLDAIDKVKWIKETNSLMLTGEPKAIEQLKGIIAKYDIPREVHRAPTRGDFFMYKPQYVSIEFLEKSLQDLVSNFKKANLADPSLITTIESMKYSSATGSLVFTGTPQSLAKVKELIAEIDTESRKPPQIQHVGKMTFLLYKLKYASGPEIETSIRRITSDLKRSRTSDKEFISALGSMKYVKETNSLLFTGTQTALEKVQALVEKFDVPGLADKKEPEVPQPPGSYFVYKPKYVPGDKLEEIVREFGEHLERSGLKDASLYQAIDSMRWIPATNSLIVTGPDTALKQVKDLLSTYDIPTRDYEQLPDESSIQAIDNTSFLVYKLQFHKGTEIQGALRSIAKDLLQTNAPVNQNLLNAINSIQLISVTNSLLCSGDQETLTRLKELIKNLDIPLKQVFIEILVLETELSNSLSFGLNWAGKAKYKDKVAGSINNSQPQQASSGFNQAVNQVNASSAPDQSMIPFADGFSLGVIGDVILHKGESFFSLGSLINAIHSDDETTIVMTPKIICQDSKTSTVFIGRNIPFVGSLVSNSGQNVVTTQNLEYRDTGVSLTITPVLGNSDIVTLDIALDNTAQIGTTTGGTVSSTGTLEGITTSKTSLNTTVHIPNKNFLILSGMINQTKRRVKTGIPCLGGIPLLGVAFSENISTDARDNTVIFIRPHIITSYRDMKDLTEKQEDFFRDQAGTATGEYDFDEGMELIKSVDDD